MSRDDVINQAIEDIADGRPVNWPALDSGALSDEERERLKCLRIVSDIEVLHRSTDEPGADEEATTERVPTPTLQADADPDIWGRYRLVEKVGEGSFGSVYRAWDPELEREIAIKILHRRFADSRLKERLLREGRALAKVRHPNVVSVFGVESYGDRVGLCMEFVRGETLATVVRTHGTLNAREAGLVGEDVCRALAAVHRAGFVHCDVKARNVMREQAGRIVLMDFGTGQEVEPLEAGARLKTSGTPMYMAPEVLAGQPVSACSDVYSVGVLLYHLVTSEYPVEGRTMDDLRDAHRGGRRRLLSERRPDLPMAFIRVVERALAADAQERWPSAGALLEALGAGTGGAQPATRTKARSLFDAVLVGAGLTCGITGLGFLSSISFNNTLERSDFAAETVRDWFVWGGKSCLAPTALLMLALATLALVVVLRSVVLASSATARRLESTVRRAFDEAAKRLHLGDTTVLASWMLVISASILVGAWWYFSPLIGAMFSYISTASAQDLAFLSPAFVAYQNQYRQVFSGITICSVIAWWQVARAVARTGRSLSWGILAGGLAIAFLSLVFLDFPYRLIYHADFDRARWNGADCYIIGERRDELLVFCPELPPPRNRIVKNNAGNVERVGVKESIFTRFAGPAASAASSQVH